MEVFKWCPLRDPEPQIEYDELIKEAQFGDGYEQTAPDGLRPQRRIFNNFAYSEEADQVLAFFMRHGKSKAFKLEVYGIEAVVRFSESPLQSLTSKKLTVSMKEVFR